MVLLKGKTLEPEISFVPESFQLQLGERDSQATLTVGPEAPEIGIGAWMQDDTEPGAGIVWRVKSVNTDYKAETRTISLEHIIQTLGDTVIPKETTAADMGGSTTVSATKAIRYVLGLQKIWTLGTCEYTLSAPYEFDGDTLMDALETISGTLADARWEYDLTSLPFKLYIRKMATGAESELRAGRNMSTISKSVDKSRMYTRIYPIGNDDLRLSGKGYIEKNTDEYGVLCKVETNQACKTENQLKIWAEDRLRRHCEPTVSITVSGLDLSRETGEALDQLKIGRRCRVPMPELGTVITEKITRLQWKDKIQDPESVTVTLANNREDVATIYKESDRTASTSRIATSKGIGGVKKKVDKEVNGLYTHITEVEGHWAAEVGNVKEEFRASIDVQANRIGLLVEGTGKNAKIRPAQITAAINNGSSEVYISADKVRLDGSVSINSIFSVTSGAILAKKSIWMGTVGAGPYLSASGITTPSIGLMSGGQGVTLRASDVAGMVVSAKLSDDEKTLTLKTKDNQTINFKKATTLEGKWSGRVFTVTAMPQEEEITTTIAGSIGRGDIAWNSDGYTGYATLYATISGKSGRVTVGTVSIDAYAAYSAGGGGASHTTRYNMYCSKALPIGSGNTDYTFTATLPSGRFSQGRDYDFWR